MQNRVNMGEFLRWMHTTRYDGNEENKRDKRI